MKMNEMETMRLYNEAMRLLNEVENKLTAAAIAHEAASGFAKAA
ncbi:hypothetical protein KOPIIPEJ_00469 [Aeromonas dhakensis]